MAQINLTMDREELLELIAGDREKALRHLAEKILDQLLLAESSQQLNADSYERALGRTDYRNGTRERQLVTRIGRLTLHVPRHRNKPFHTMLFENYSRSEAAFISTMAEMVINGVSTRKISRVMETLCGTSVSKSSVSEVCKKLDPEIEKFRNSPLDDREYPFVVVDATYFKVREAHRITSKAFMLAIGYTPEGKREVIGFNVYDDESNPTWINFFTSLKKRGLHGVRMVTSDAHPAILHGLTRVFPGVPWQRCQFHFTRNIVDATPKKYQKGIAVELREVFNRDNIEDARKRMNELAKDYQDIAPNAVDILQDGFEDTMTVMNLPEEFRSHIRTSNPIERVNRELKRRGDVIKIFPNAASLLRLMGAVTIEYNDILSMRQALFQGRAVRTLTPELTNHLKEIAYAQKSLSEAA
jgi:transposase-like protein